MTTLREILDERKEKAKPVKYGPPKGRPWGRERRRLFRLEHGEQYPGPFYGAQLHYKNAASAREYRAGLDAIMATGVEGEALQAAVEDLQHHHCKTVTIYEGLHSKVRQMMRSAYRREDRKYATEHNSQHTPRSPEDRA